MAGEGTTSGREDHQGGGAGTGEDTADDHSGPARGSFGQAGEEAPAAAKTPLIDVCPRCNSFNVRLSKDATYFTCGECGKAGARYELWTSIDGEPVRNIKREMEHVFGSRLTSAVSAGVASLVNHFELKANKKLQASIAQHVIAVAAKAVTQSCSTVMSRDQLEHLYRYNQLMAEKQDREAGNAGLSISKTLPRGNSGDVGHSKAATGGTEGSGEGDSSSQRPDQGHAVSEEDGP